MSALLVALLLVLYANVMATLSARRRWDQWQAFTIGNSVLGLALLAYAAVAGLLPAVWGQVTGSGLLLGVIAGLLPLAMILALMFLPGQLGRDIVASGVSTISTRGFVYRVGVQVTLATVVFEEFAFRGVLQVLLVQAVGVPRSAAFDAFAFGLWHVVLQYNGFASLRGPGRWGAALGGSLVYAVLGLILSVVWQSGGGLAAVIVAHGILDILMFAAMFVRRHQILRADARTRSARA